jgi:hypothetical protein
MKSLVFAVCLLLSGATTSYDSLRHTDVVELNTVYNDFNGEELYTQVIWWNWDKKLKTEVVVDYRLLYHCIEPTLALDKGYYVTKWFDRKVKREVRSTVYRRTKTWHPNDPEEVNRKILPRYKRPTMFRGNTSYFPIKVECE